MELKYTIRLGTVLPIKVISASKCNLNPSSCTSCTSRVSHGVTLLWQVCKLGYQLDMNHCQLLIMALMASDRTGSGIAIALSVSTSLMRAMDFFTCISISKWLGHDRHPTFQNNSCVRIPDATHVPL